MNFDKNKKDSRIKIEDLDMVSATQAKNRFGDLLHRVCYEKKNILIERGGKPMAVIMDLEHYLDLKKKARTGSSPIKTEKS